MNHAYVLVAVLYLGRTRFVSKEILSSTTTYYRIFKLNLIVIDPPRPQIDVRTIMLQQFHQTKGFFSFVTCTTFRTININLI